VTANLVSAQVTQEWVATYPGTGSGYNFPKKSAIDKDGNFIVAGNSDSTHGYDYIVLKYSPSGNLIWKQRYNGTGNSYDYLIGMVLDDSGNVYVTGESDDGAALGGINWVTIKYNTNGQMKWKRSLNWTGNYTDEPFGMNIDKERNIYVVGFGITSSVYRQMVTIKYSSNGDSLWTKVYRISPTTHDWGYSVVTDDSLNVYSSGYGDVPTGNEIITIKYDQNGVEKWIEKYPTYYGDWLRPTYSAIDKENNLVVVGYSYISNYYDIITLKYNTEGSLLWSRIYDGGDIDRAQCIFIDDHSDILIAGCTFQNTEGDFLILKYDKDGDTLLIKNINGEDPGSTDEAFSVVSDSVNNIYVTGYSQSSSFRYDYLTIKLSSYGDTIWSKKYRTNYDNYSYCLSLDKTGNVFISGESFLPNGNTGIVSVKYSTITGILSERINEFGSYDLYNYPNPFNPSTKIKYTLPKEGIVKITIYNSLGQRVTELVNEFKQPGAYIAEFNARIAEQGADFPSGIYFYQLESNGIVLTGRMLLIK
jgi:hypothetical protein